MPKIAIDVIDFQKVCQSAIDSQIGVGTDGVHVCIHCYMLSTHVDDDCPAFSAEKVAEKYGIEVSTLCGMNQCIAAELKAGDE